MSITNDCIFLAYTVLYDIIHQKQEKSKNIYDFGKKRRSISTRLVGFKSSICGNLMHMQKGC